ncbi:MAG: ROK family transcriptional regulator [Clostridiaceae bacterium]|nr:ROK family transcriptional regulator [Clostridiaceae bacterium]
MKHGVNQFIQKQNNLSLILHYLVRNRSCTRVWLAKKTGLTQASVGKHIAQLLEWGMVTEEEGITTEKGRRPRRLELQGAKYRSISIRINRDYITCALFDMSGRQYDHKQIPVKATEGVDAAMAKMYKAVGHMIRTSDIKPICMGLAVAGPYNKRTGKIVLMSGFPGWEKVDLQAELEKAFSIQTFVEHDAVCGAMAETWFGSSSPNSNLIFIAADKGIGAGMVINGNIYEGRDGFAGEFGHSSINVFGPQCECGNLGCLELYGTLKAMLDDYKDEVGNPLDTGLEPEEITEEYFIRKVREKDPTAVEIYKKTIGYLGFGVVGLVNTMSPDTVVFGDKIIIDRDLFIDTVTRVLKRYLVGEIFQGLEIRTALPDMDSILVGASVIAFERLLQDPSASFTTD